MKRNTLAVTVLALAVIVSYPGAVRSQCGGGAHSGEHTTHAEKASSGSKPIVYPVDFCVVSGQKLGAMGDPVKYEHDGRTVYFCCEGCIKKFEAEPAKYLAALDAAIVNAADAVAKPSTGKEISKSSMKPADTSSAKASPKLTSLDWCIVSGDSLGAMGKTVAHEYKGRELTFCCKGCIKEFESAPTAYLARLDSALAGQIQQPKPAPEEKSSREHGGTDH